MHLTPLEPDLPGDGASSGILLDDEPLMRRVEHRALVAGLAGSAPYYRKRLHNRDFSIISNDCWGAEVYQHLDLPYRTPFVGLFLAAPCFLRMLGDLPGHLGGSLEFIEQSGYPYLERARRRSPRPYPVGLLAGAVELHFVHYETEQEARAKWERRVERVDYDNLFVKLSADKDLCTRDRIEQFDAMPYSRKLCLTARPYAGIDCAVRVPGYVSNGATMYRVCLPHVNVVRWLNGGQASRRRSLTAHRRSERRGLALQPVAQQAGDPQGKPSEHAGGVAHGGERRPLRFPRTLGQDPACDE
jgi:uncharacterized protein (DUF1919 family)